MASVLVNNEIRLLIYDYIEVKPQISCYIYLRIILLIESKFYLDQGRMLEFTVCSFFLSCVQNMNYREGINQVHSHDCISRLGSFPQRLYTCVSAALLSFMGCLCRLSLPDSR